MINNLILLHKLCCLFWRHKTHVFADNTYAQTVPVYMLLKNVGGMNWAGFQQQRAAGCPVWEEAMNCPMLLTVMSCWPWHWWCAPNPQLIRGAQSIPAWTHVRRSISQQGQETHEETVCEAHRGKHCRGDMWLEMCSGQKFHTKRVRPWGTAAMTHPHQGKDTPEGLQLWATHTRAGTALRDHKWHSLAQAHWEAKKSRGKSAGSKEEQQKETIRDTTFLLCPSPHWRSRGWAEHNLQQKTGKSRSGG